MCNYRVLYEIIEYIMILCNEIIEYMTCVIIEYDKCNTCNMPL